MHVHVHVHVCETQWTLEPRGLQWTPTIRYHKCKRLHKPEEISCTPDLWHAVHTVHVHVHHVHVYTMCMYLLCFSSSSCAFCSRSSCILFSSSLCFYSHVQYMCKYIECIDVECIVDIMYMYTCSIPWTVCWQ